MDVARVGHEFARVRLLEQAGQSRIRAVVAEESAIFPGRGANGEARRLIGMMLKEGRVDAGVHKPPQHPDAVFFPDDTQGGNSPAELSQAAGGIGGATTDLTAKLSGERLLTKFRKGSKVA